MQINSQVRTTVRRAAVAVVAAAAVTGTVAVTSAAAAPVHAHAASNKVGFLLVASDETHETGVMHGALTGAGKVVSHDQYDVAHLNGGTFRLNHPDSQSKFSYHYNPTTCYAVFNLSGKYTMSDGTGRFAGYTGKGTYTGHGEGVLKRTKAGKCNTNGAGIATAFVIKGTGTVTKK